MKVYIDTCVFIDYFLIRKDIIRPLNDFANLAFEKIKKNNYELIISDLILTELKKTFNHSDEIKEFFKDFKIIKVTTDNKDKIKAKQYKTHYSDALHFVLAKKAKADILITRNINDFLEFSKDLYIKLPENF